MGFLNSVSALIPAGRSGIGRVHWLRHVSTEAPVCGFVHAVVALLLVAGVAGPPTRQYVYFGTSKASKLVHDSTAPHTLLLHCCLLQRRGEGTQFTFFNSTKVQKRTRGAPLYGVAAPPTSVFVLWY
jgi:hypothetical protein